MTEQQADYNCGNAAHLLLAGARLAQFYRRGEAGRWTAAFFAAQIVGRYERGATRELADELAVSPDTIEALARAAIVYCELKAATRQLPEPEREAFRVVSELRQKLTVSHFAEAGRLAKAHDLIPLDVFAMLQSAAEYPRTAVNRMRELVDAENGGGKPTAWQGQVRRVYASLLNISTNGAAPAWLVGMATGWANVLRLVAQRERVEL